MQISISQKRVLEDPARRSLVESLAASMRRHGFRNAVDVDDETLHARIEAGLERARLYGCRAQNDLAAFVTLMFAAGPTFDTEPSIRRILRLDEASFTDRLLLMRGLTPPASWATVESADTDAAWADVVRESRPYIAC